MKNERKNKVQLDSTKGNVIFGTEGIESELRDLISEQASPIIIGFDGFPKSDWDIVSVVWRKLSQDFDIELKNGFSIYKSTKEIWREIGSYLTSDKYFGFTYDGSLDNFLSKANVRKLKEDIKESSQGRDAVICFGTGISYRESTRELFDALFYLDLKKRVVLERMNEELPWFVHSEASFGEKVADVGLSLQSFKLSQYVFPSVFEEQRRELLENSWLDYYVDANVTDEPRTITEECLANIASRLATKPISFNPVYVPSPWGGQWFKRREGLSEEDYPNCAWKFEMILPEMSLEVQLNEDYITIPGNTLLGLKNKEIAGEKSAKKGGRRFPIRTHYDDNWNGDNMAIQVHPDKEYAKREFNESIGQHEAYYIMEAQPDSKVYLGLKEGVSPDELHRKARRAEEEGVPLDYDNYLESFDSQPGDLFLIPAGTIHALGKGNVCLEIGIGWGYTFHVYDYLRPDLRGNLRPIHLNHAFSVLDSTRTTKKVKDSLIKKPMLINKAQGWNEFVLGRHSQIPWEVRRMEVSGVAEISMKGRFHILVVTAGESVKVKTEGGTKKLGYTNSVLIPASVDNYSLKNEGSSKSEILKVLPLQEE